MVVCQKELEVRRYEEELLLLEKEMGQYLMYFKDIVLPDIKMQISILEAPSDPSSCLQEEGDTSSKDEEKGTYAVIANLVPVVNGKLALLKCGLDFALRQLSAGVRVFSKVKKEPGNDLQDLLKSLEEEGTCEEKEEDEDDMDEDEDNSDGARNEGGICDGDGSVEEENELNFEKGNITMEQECVPLNATPPVLGIFGESCFGPGVCRWSFPLEFSQGNIGGRNGSNACSLIALLVGFFVIKRSMSLPLEGVLPNLWKSLLLQCMDLGNKTYDDFRQSLPHRYLSTAEAADVLSAICDVEPDDPLPVRLVDDDDRSTLAFQLCLICEREKHAVATITINSRTSIFIVDSPHISYIDSHCHNQHGAVILTGHCSSLDVFCNTVWEIENHDPGTFGNLTVVEYRFK